MTEDEWDDDEIVPLGELRPSREHFGPLPSPGQKPKGNRNAPQRRQPARPSGEARQRPSAQRGAAPQRALPSPKQQRQAPPREQRPRPPQQQPVPSARERSSSSPPSPSARRPASQQRPDHRDEHFVNRLAEKERASIVVKPTSGWRGAVLKASGGKINLGPSPEERQESELRQLLRRPVANGTIGVFSRKGGVGKTTISAYLGLTLATERGGRIVALDGDAEAGSLGWLLAPKAPSTLAALASANPIPSDYAGLRRYTVATPEGLEIIVGDPAELGPISTTGLEAVADQLGRNYDLSIFDTGAGVTRATGRVLVNRARVLLLVMGPSVDSVRAAERTLAWLDERPGEAANQDAQVIAVINGIPPTTKTSHVDRIEDHFAERCSAVVRIPWDAHLAAGSSSVSLDNLAKPTRRALLELAAVSVRTLSRSRRPTAGARRAS